MPNKKLNCRLYYSPISKSWSIWSKGRSIKARSIRWGANRSPLPMSINKMHKSRIPAFSASIVRDGESWSVGPLLGILASRGKHKSFTGNRSNFIDLMATGKKRGVVVFVFTPDSVNWEAKQITGQFYNFKQKGWVKAEFPFPNVVYNRVATRRQEMQPAIQSCINRLIQQSQVTLFNPKFFNKQEIYKQIEGSSQVKKFLPETKDAHAIEDLMTMLGKYNQIYLKPTKGKAGKGIMRVVKRDNSFFLSTQRSKYSRRIGSIQRLWQLFKLEKKKSHYVIQQGISLVRYQGNPFDFRVLVQKNGQGKWEVTGVGIRVAGKNRITTHVPQGGRIENPLQVLTSIYSSSQATSIINKVKSMALQIAEELEGHYSHLGEMSMDIGLDSNQNLWFFEANSKPMKFDEPQIRKKSLNNLIDYSRYIFTSGA